MANALSLEIKDMVEACRIEDEAGDVIAGTIEEQEQEQRMIDTALDLHGALFEIAGRVSRVDFSEPEKAKAAVLDIILNYDRKD